MMTDWDEDWDSKEEPRSAGERRTDPHSEKKDDAGVVSGASDASGLSGCIVSPPAKHARTLS